MLDDELCLADTGETGRAERPGVEQTAEPAVSAVGVGLIVDRAQGRKDAAVAELDDPDDASELLFGAVGFVQEPDIPVRRGRIFVGYAGWSAGQLESELEEESWLVLPAEPDDLFSDDPDGLWSAVLRRQGGPYALLSLMPPDPSLN